MAIKNWELYQRTVDFLRLRKRAYQMAFQNRKNNEVLRDLSRFCYANRTPKVKDLFSIGVATGRREVWLRIQEHLNLTPEELFELYNSPSAIQPKERE